MNLSDKEKLALSTQIDKNEWVFTEQNAHGERIQ